MHRHWLDPEGPPTAPGPLHAVPAGVKLAVALAIVLVLAAAPVSWRLYAMVAALLAVGVLLGRVRIGTILRRLLFAEIFVLGVAVLSLFQPDGLRVFAAVVTRGTLCVGIVVLLGAVTPFHDMLAVMKRARVPGIMVTTITLMHRYLHVLVDESRRMKTARASRTFVASRRGVWSSTASVVSQLFVRASARSERIYAAMCSRGWE